MNYGIHFLLYVEGLHPPFSLPPTHRPTSPKSPQLEVVKGSLLLRQLFQLRQATDLVPYLEFSKIQSYTSLTMNSTK